MGTGASGDGGFDWSTSSGIGETEFRNCKKRKKTADD